MQHLEGDRCDVVCVASPLHAPDVVANMLHTLRPALDRAGVRVVDTPSVAEPNRPFGVLVLTGGTEQAILSAFYARLGAERGAPVLLLVHAAHNSLPAALEALARIRIDGGRGRIVPVGAARAGECSGDDLDDAIADLSVWHSLRASRVGLIGKPSDWLVASTPDLEAVTRLWGPTFIELSLAPVFDRFSGLRDTTVAVAVRSGARLVTGPNEADLQAAARFECALREVVSEHRLDAVAVRCFDALAAIETSGCVALSGLNDAGLIAGCEGDVLSTLGLLWSYRLTGVVGWMANPAWLSRSSATIQLAHCTVPRSLVSQYSLSTHFESGIGVAIAGELPPGPITLFRIGGRDGEQLWCANGEAVATVPRDGRCRTQLDVKVNPDAIDELLDHPLGNHLIAVAGHDADRLRRWWHRFIAEPTTARR